MRIEMVGEQDSYKFLAVAVAQVGVVSGSWGILNLLSQPQVTQQRHKSLRSVRYRWPHLTIALARG